MGLLSFTPSIIFIFSHSHPSILFFSLSPPSLLLIGSVDACIFHSTLILLVVILFEDVPTHVFFRTTCQLGPSKLLNLESSERRPFQSVLASVNTTCIARAIDSTASPLQFLRSGSVQTAGA